MIPRIAQSALFSTVTEQIEQDEEGEVFPFTYGYRYERRFINGEEDWVEVPLTLDDVLHPQFEDFVNQHSSHSIHMALGQHERMMAWYDADGNRLLDLAEQNERAEQERLRAEQAETRAEQAETRAEQAEARARAAEEELKRLKAKDG